jgi:hypothetical protein
MEYRGATAVVDTNGIGAGVFDKIRRRGMSATPLNVGTLTKLRDKSGQIEFYNIRAAATWKLREALDPAQNPTLCLPVDEKLAGDLSAPRWKNRAGGKMVIEDKGEVRKRISRSPDRGDAVILANWLNSDENISTDESSFDWVDDPDEYMDDGDVAIDWVPASDEPNLEPDTVDDFLLDTSIPR